MKVSDQIIETLTGEKASEVKLLEICNAELLFIENLQKCYELRILNLRGNFIKEVENIYTLKNLWSLDLAHNELTSVTGLSRFVAFGTLNLSFNNLAWKSLGDIKHIHICNLHLQGNVEIEKDKYYRTHIIDSLPNVWSLDGKFISAIDRLDVHNFFTQSEMSKHPIRSKLAKQERFQPTYKKNILTYGVFGEKAEELFMNFPTRDNSLVINSEMDRKKLSYMAYNLEEEIETEKPYAFDVLECEFAERFMEDLLHVRSVERERCNMFLLLLLASLDPPEAPLPLHLIREMLQTAQLDFIGGVNTVPIFEYPRRIRLEVASILAGAAKVDRDENLPGGLYPILFSALEKTLDHLTSISNSDRVQYIKRRVKKDPEYLRLRPILAAEVVQLLCVTPSFYDIADSDPAVQSLLSVALGDEIALEKTMGLLSRLHKRSQEVNLGQKEEDEWEGEEQGEREREAIMEDIAKFIVSNVHINTSEILSGKKTPTKKLNSFERPTSRISVTNLSYRPRSGYKQKEYASTLTWLHEKLSPRRRVASATAASRASPLAAPSSVDPMNAGVVGRKLMAVDRPLSSAGLYNDVLRSSRHSGSAVYRPTSGKKNALPPRIGDVVLLAPQNSGHIISIPDRNIALIMIAEATAVNGGVVSRLTNDEERFVYVRLDQLQFDHTFGWWKPNNYFGDRVTLMDSKRYTKFKVDPVQLAFETRMQFNPSGTLQQQQQQQQQQHQQQQPKQDPALSSSAQTSLVASLVSSERGDQSPNRGEGGGGGDSPVEWGRMHSSQLERVEIPLNEKEDELLGLKEDDESDSTKGMSRASSPVGDSKTESKQRRIESRLENDDEIQKTASDLAAKIINLAIEEIASGSSPDALAEEIFLQNEEKTENMSENIETLDNFHTDDDQIATVNIEIKNKNLIENWDANEGEARPFGLERASYLNEKNDIKAQKEITIDLDGVIANDSHVFINQVDKERDESKSPTLSYRDIRFSSKGANWSKGFDAGKYAKSTDVNPVGPNTPVGKGLAPRRAKTASTAGRLRRAKQIVPTVKSGGRWLAGGKNVYQPTELSESFLIPGWVQSMEPRAKKAYMRRMVDRYSESSSYSRSSTASVTVPSRVSIRAMSAQMKNVCNNCSPTSRTQLMERYYSPNLLPRISDPETHWRHNFV